MAEKSLDGPFVLVCGRGVSDDLLRRIQKALSAVPEVQVVSEVRSVRDQLRNLLNSPQPEEQVAQDKIVARLQEYADKLEQARKVGAEKVDALIEATPDGMGVHEIDNQKVIQKVSPSELRLLGYRNASEMIGRPVWKFVVMQETAQRSIEKKMAGHLELKPFVRVYARADGTPIRLVIVDRYIYDAAGSITGICSVIAESALSGGA
jgi:PAS domain S-box-containing protein